MENRQGPLLAELPSNLENVEAALTPLAETSGLTVEVREPAFPRAPLHVSDLLLDGDERGSIDDADATAAEQPVERVQPTSSRSAISQGPSLEPAADLPEALRRAARKAAATTITYVGLLGEAERVLADLRAAGLRSQDKVILHLKRPREFITGFWMRARRIRPGAAVNIARRSWDLSSMRFILNGGEAIVAKTARRFLQLLAPHGLRPAAMYPAWGMSETCSGVTYSHEFRGDTTRDDDLLVEVGAPVSGFSVRIVGAENRPLNEGVIGRLQVKGPNVTTGYYGNPAATGEVFTDNGWLRRYQAGEFATVLKEVDLAVGGARTVPDWFFRRVWRRREIRDAERESQRGPVLILGGGGTGETLATALVGRGVRVVRVEAGSAIERVAPIRYVLRPAETNDYLHALAADGLRPSAIVNLWCFGKGVDATDRPLEATASSLLTLVRAIAQGGVTDSRPIRLLVGTSRSQQVVTGEQVVPARASLAALVRTANDEAPNLVATLVDLPDVPIEHAIDGLVAELGTTGRESLVGYRDGVRWVQRLESADLESTPKAPLPFRRGGFYLVAGGLGGVGAEVSRFLLDKYGARLLILGRRPMPPDDASANDALAQAFRRLAAHGDAVSQADQPLAFFQLLDAEGSVLEGAGRRTGAPARLLRRLPRPRCAGASTVDGRRLRLVHSSAHPRPRLCGGSAIPLPEFRLSYWTETGSMSGSVEGLLMGSL